MLKSAKLNQSLKGLTDMGKSIDEASKTLEIDASLAWALLLQKEEDINKLKKLEDKNKGLDCSPRPYDIWNFGNSFPLFGREGYPGQIPGYAPHKEIGEVVELSHNQISGILSEMLKSAKLGQSLKGRRAKSSPLAMPCLASPGRA